MAESNSLEKVKHELKDSVDLRFYNEKDRSFHPKRLEDEADAMPEGFSADQDETRADQLTREMAEAFVEKVIVWLGQKLEIRRKTKK